MRIAVTADAGYEISIAANVASDRLALITVKTGSAPYDSEAELEKVTLSVEQARELANALTSVADAVEFVRINGFALP